MPYKPLKNGGLQLENIEKAAIEFGKFMTEQIFKLEFEELQEITKKIIKRTDKKLNKEFKIGDKVKILANGYNNLNNLTGKIGVIIFVVDSTIGIYLENIAVIQHKDYIKKVEDKQHEEPFELEVGRKFKALGLEEILKVESININPNFKDEKIYLSNGIAYYKNHIDWEETKNLNVQTTKYKSGDRVKIIKSDIRRYRGALGIIDYPCKNSIYSITLENGEIVDFNENQLEQIINIEYYYVYNPTCDMSLFTKLETAEKEAERLAILNHDKDFYILKSVAKVRGTVKVEWSND